MKLETKFQDKDFELGEVVKAKVTTYYDENKVVVFADRARGGVSRFEYNSIKEFTDHWEDYKESLVYYAINEFGTIESYPVGCISDEDRKLIGNYFETEKEAKEALEKLKAWKRLKDSGFKFLGETCEYKADKHFGSVFYETSGDVSAVYEDISGFFDDLDLIFERGEE